MKTKKLLFIGELLLLCCDVTNEFQAFAAPLLNSVTESIVRLKVLKFSAAAFIALTVIWLLIRSALTMLSVISFDRFTNSSVYCGVTIGKFTLLANIF